MALVVSDPRMSDDVKGVVPIWNIWWKKGHKTSGNGLSPVLSVSTVISIQENAIQEGIRKMVSILSTPSLPQSVDYELRKIQNIHYFIIRIDLSLYISYLHNTGSAVAVSNRVKSLNNRHQNT